jgi:hypothetical protein
MNQQITEGILVAAILEEEALCALLVAMTRQVEALAAMQAQGGPTSVSGQPASFREAMCRLVRAMSLRQTTLSRLFAASNRLLDAVNSE